MTAPALEPMLGKYFAEIKRILHGFKDFEPLEMKVVRLTSAERATKRRRGADCQMEIGSTELVG